MVLVFDVFNPVRPNARVEMLNQRSGFMCSVKSPSQAATQPISLWSAAPAKPRVERGLTTILFVAAVFLWGIGLTALFSGKIQWTTYLFLCIPIHWLFLVAAHDALHQSAHHNSKINRLVGWRSKTARQQTSGADRIRTCGTGFPVHRFSKPALSTTQPPPQNLLPKQNALHC